VVPTVDTSSTVVGATMLVFASLNGQLVFTLLPEGSQPANTPGRTITNLFN
jgi:hypothetical protein